MTTPALSAVDQVSAAMSVSSLQHEVIASNIANRDTQGYQRLKLHFDQAMDPAATATVVTDRSSTDVSLEQDLIAMSANSMRYETLALTLSRYFSIIASITNSNRG